MQEGFLPCYYGLKRSKKHANHYIINVYHMSWSFTQVLRSRSDQASGKWRKWQNWLWFFGTFLVQSWNIDSMWFIWTIGEKWSSTNEGEINDLKLIFLFFNEIWLNCEICSLFSGSKQQVKNNLETTSKLYFLPQVSCKSEFKFCCWLYLILAPPDDILSKKADLSPNYKMSRKIWIWK